VETGTNAGVDGSVNVGRGVDASIEDSTGVNVGANADVKVGIISETTVVRMVPIACGAAALFTFRSSGSSSYIVVTTVLKVRGRDENITNDGVADSGVCRIDRVVGGMV